MSAFMLTTHQLQCLAVLANIATGRPPESGFKLMAMCNRKSLRHRYTADSAQRLIDSADLPITPWSEVRAAILQASTGSLQAMLYSADYQCCESPAWTHSPGRVLLLECLWMIAQSNEWRKR